MITDHQCIGLALELLSEGVFPFFERELRAVYGDRWEDTARTFCRSQSSVQLSAFHWDAQAILTVMWDTWNAVFRKKLGVIERSLVSELREFRNRWAHQTQFTEDDSYRVLDNVQRLLISCEAPVAAVEIEERKLDLLREKLGRRVNAEAARVRFSRARLVDAALYLVCAFAIALMVILMLGERLRVPAMFVAGFTAFVFSYLIYKRVQAPPPAYGVHECSKCGKIIYSECCPYCDPISRSLTAVKAVPPSVRLPRSQDLSSRAGA